MNPTTRAKYPENWKKISTALREQIPYCEVCFKADYQVPHLTVHHRDYNPANNAQENLLVCCPKCHFAIQVDEGNAGKILPLQSHRGTLNLQATLF